MCVILYIVYIFRQTYFAREYEIGIVFSLITIAISIALLNMQKLWQCILIEKEEFILILVSLVIAATLFSGIEHLIVTILKFALIFAFIVILVVKNNKILIIMADAGILCLISLGILNSLELIASKNFDNQIWIKNNLAFNNPNIGPFFAFSSLFVYFTKRENCKFWLLSALVISSWLILNFYSRTLLLGVSLLIAYKLIELFCLDVNKFTKFFIWALLLSTIASFTLGVALIAGWVTSTNVIYQKINTYSSARLFLMSKNPFVVSSSGQIVTIDAFDSIYYELIFILGPYFIYRIITFWRRVVVNANLITPHCNKIYAVAVFFYLGLFEGLIFKFSPLIIFVGGIIFCNTKDQESIKISNEIQS